jgi:hypothetical protein
MTNTAPIAFSVSQTAPRSAEYRDVYANQSRMTITPSDLSITFSVLSDRGPGVLTLEDVFSVRLAPMTAKVFSLHLQAVMETYQSVLGEISIPASVSSQIDGYKESLRGMLATQMGLSQPPS